MAEHPITPPPELVSEWTRNRGYSCSSELWDYIATQAARWGADTELDACCQYINRWFATPEYRCAELHAARRPKPPSLKEQALLRTDAILNDPNPALPTEVRETLELNRRALEALPDD